MSKPEQAAPKAVRAKVVTNYGNHRPGAWVEVTEREYHRLRKSDGEGGFVFPVLISGDDEKAQLERARKAEEQLIEQRRHSDDRGQADGWQKYQQESMRIVQAQRIEEQKRQHAALAGVPSPETAEQQAEKFKQRVAAARMG